MFERYCYLTNIFDRRDYDYANYERPTYWVFDRMKGMGRDKDALLITQDPDVAQRIVDLLNADDERLRIGKLVRARETLGSEIVEVFNLSRVLD